MKTSKSEGRVIVSKNGPYLVSAEIPLSEQTILTDDDGGSERWSEAPPMKTRGDYALCRCGHSKAKPFCDGTHAKIGFDGSEAAPQGPYLELASVFDGPDIALTDVEQLCAFGRFCDPNGQVWNQVEKADDPVVRANFIRQVGNCPAGRLVAWDKRTNSAIEPGLPVSIGLVEDPAQECSGPLWLRGGITVVSGLGFEYERRNRVTLCRCGQSQNKPFCDGSHAQIKFHAK